MQPPRPRPRRDDGPRGGEERFLVVRPLGAGALGSVELVRDARRGALFARKSVPVAEEERHRVLEREYRIRARVAHPQVPIARELGRAGAHAYLLTDYVEGDDLTEALRRLGSDAAPLLLAQALNVLAWLHQIGVVHGDVKPANLCVQGLVPGAEPLLHLLDFGTSIDLSLGEVEWIGGTPEFLAPYLERGAPPGPKSDLFALGRSFLTAAEEAGVRLGHGVRDVASRLAQADPDLAHADADAAHEDLLARVPELSHRLDSLFLPLPRRAQLVGRRRERELFAVRREELAAGFLRRHLTLLTGPAGIGKARLLEELEQEAVLEGVEVVRLSCGQRTGTLEPVLELFARLVAEDDPQRARLAHAVAPGSIASSTTGPTTGPAADSTVEGDALSQRALRELARAVRREAAGRPLILLFDDLEEADEHTVDFLRILARLDGPYGPWILGALRAPEEEEGYVPARRLLAPGELAEELILEPLSKGETRELVRGVLPRRLDRPGLVEDAARLSAGEPGAATELAIALALRDAPREAGQEALRDALFERRLAARSADELTVARVLALLERPTPLPILAELAELPEERLGAALEGLRFVGLLEVEARRVGPRYELTSPALARHLSGSLAHGESRRLHARALRAWSAWPVSFERPTDMLARHAIAAGLTERALELGRTAARQLVARGGLHAAETTIRALLPLLADPTGSADARAELEGLLAELCLRTGRHAEARTRALAFGDPAGEATGLSPGHRGRLLGVLGSLAETEGDYAAAAELLEVAHRLAGRHQDAGERQRLSEQLGLVRYRRGDFAGAREVWEAGLELETAPTGRGRGTADLLNDLGVLDFFEGLFDSALARHTEALEIRRRVGDLDGESRSLTNLANVAHARGELSQAAEMHEEALRLKRLVGTVPAQALSLRNLGAIYRHRGEHGKAIACLEESIELRAAAGERVGESATRRGLALVLHAKGEAAGATRELVAARALLEAQDVHGPELADLLAAEARIALDEGAVERSLQLSGLGLEELGEAQKRTTRADLLEVRGRALVTAGHMEEGLAGLEAAVTEAEAGRLSWQVLGARVTLCTAWLEGLRANAFGAEAPALAERVRLELGELIAEARATESPEPLAQALLVRFDLECDGSDEELGVGALLEAQHLAARLGLPLLEIAAGRRMGRQAYGSGLVHRAVDWWRRSVERLGEYVGVRPPEVAASILGLPEHRGLLRDLERALEGADVLAPGEGTGGRVAELVAEGEPRYAGATAETLAGLVLLAADFVARPEDRAEPEARSLRPEVLTRLLEISRAMNGMHHREEILSYLRQRLEELFGAENSQIVLIGRDGSFHLMGESSESSEHAISRTVLARVLSEKRPVLVEDTQRDLELRDKQSVHRLGLASVLCAPLIVDDDVIGVIQFDQRQVPGPFREEDLVVLELFAHQAATALRNMLLVERLDDSIEQLESSEAELVAGERMRALGEMAAGITHEFNNLLTIVVGLTDLMRSQAGLSSETLADIDTLETVSNTAAETVRRLQEFRGEVRRSASRVDVAQVIRQSAELGRLRFLGDRLHRIELDLIGSPTVLGTESELREVCLNLIINAVEAMPTGGTVSLRLREEEGEARVSIEDEGVGVPPEVGQRVFEPFFTTKESGQGMGLSITWGIVQRMQGQLRVETRAERERGACFRLSLPLAPRERAGASDAERIPSLAAQGRGSDSRVLVVDDDPVVREVICRLLTSAGFQPVGSGDGREALELFEAKHFDLVLTDYALPRISGTEIAREVKRMRADCPVVLLTGVSPDRLEQELQAAEPVGEVGAEGAPVNLVLRKPITSAKLATALSLSVG